MGNGQCDECCGNKPNRWAPHPCVPSTVFEGHRIGCDYAARMESMGLPVTYQEIPKNLSLSFSLKVKEEDYESREAIDKFKEEYNITDK